MSKYLTYAPSRSYLRRASGPLFLVVILSYLGFHAISGERGLLALFTETRKLSTLKMELADVSAKREAVERKVRRLSDDSLDLDLLDEQARRELGMAGKDEIILLPDQ